MKSVTIRDTDGKIMVQVDHRKNGAIDCIILKGLRTEVEVRDDQNGKHTFKGDAE